MLTLFNELGFVNNLLIFTVELEIRLSRSLYNVIVNKIKLAVSNICHTCV